MMIGHIYIVGDNEDSQKESPPSKLAMTETKTCKFCKEEIDAEAMRCPHCGGDFRWWMERHRFGGSLLFIFLILLGLYIMLHL